MSAEKENMIELAKTIKTFNEAFRAAIRLWGGTEKQIWLELGIDKGHWHRCLSGSAHFPNQFIPNFCEIVGNNLVLQWLAYQCGYELRIIPKTLEDQLEKERDENAQLKAKLQYLENLLTRKEKE